MDRQMREAGCLLANDVPPHRQFAVFDSLPKRVRTRLNESPFKLCLFCVHEHDLGAGRKDRTRILLARIEQMERLIRLMGL